MRCTKPRCVLVYALAPDHISPAAANRQLNDFVADSALPLVIFHDHFLGEKGGMAIFFVETAAERIVLQKSSVPSLLLEMWYGTFLDRYNALVNSQHLAGWRVEFRPLIFSCSPAAFDKQTAYTLRAYREIDWEKLQ